MRAFVTAITFVTTAFLVLSFMSADAYMDAGGIWLKFGFVCEGANENFVPQYKRLAPFSWLIVLMVSAGSAFATSNAIRILQTIIRHSSRGRANNAAP